MSIVLVERNNGVVTVTLNRPESMNALSPDMFRELLGAFAELKQQGDVGAVVLTGAGKGFCAGGDVKAMADRGSWTLEQRADDLRWKQELALVIAEFPAVTIAAVHGAAMGAGLGLALVCDFRIVARSAKLATAFGAVGFSGDFLTGLNLTRLVGPIKAKELMILNPRLTAEEADALGLVTRLVDDEALLAEAQAFAGQIAAGPRVAHRYMKKNLNAAWNASLAEMLEMEALHQARTAMTGDHAEARAAFAEKRASRFTGA